MRRGPGATRARRPRPFLQLERLEERWLPSAAPLAWVAVLPNDSSYSSQWGLNNTGQWGGRVDTDIDAPEAWNVTTGSLSTVVGIVDTGVDYTHVDLYKNIWINQKEIPGTVRVNLIDIDADGLITFWDLNNSRNQGTGKVLDVNHNGRIDGGDLLAPLSQGGWEDGRDNDREGHVDDLIGWDFLNNDNDPYDDNRHGTHVAGIVGAIGDNGVGITGVNWRVQMIALKFLGADGSGSVGGAVGAINYAVAHDAIASNHSWAMGNTYYQPLYDAMNRARNAGHIIVAAAGNGGGDSVGDNNDNKPTYPASFALSNILSVAATTNQDVLTTYSNYGKKTVDLVAPGASIYSTVPGDKYQFLGGTSMATPHVTGVVALLHSAHPEWSISQIITKIVGSVDKVSALDTKVSSGGRLNAGRALGATTADVVGAHVVSLVANGPGSGPIASVRVTFSESIDPASFTTADVVLTGPNGGIAISGIQIVSGSSNSQFDITFASQSTPGTYTLTLGPDVRDSSGNRLDQDRDGLAGESTADKFKGTFAIGRVTNFVNGGVRIADNTTSVCNVVVDRDLTIADLNVKLTLTHPNCGELRLLLRAPDGTQIVLFDHRGNATTLKETLFDDAATTAIANGTGTFTGTFRPEQLLSAFDGKNARGTWQIIIEDTVPGNYGRFNVVTLMFEEVPSTQAASAPNAKGDNGEFFFVETSDSDTKLTPTESPTRHADRTTVRESRGGQLGVAFHLREAAWSGVSDHDLIDYFVALTSSDMTNLNSAINRRG